MTPATRRDLLRTGGLAAAGVGATALVGCSAPEKKTTGPAEVAAADVPVGSGKILEGTNYVVTQPTKGSFCAFVRACPHAGCDVSKVVESEIICTCHDSRFSISDGSRLSGPATAGLGKATAKASGDKVSITA
ncbi:Rieske (2Fe-2S) protein [Luteococcus peritonei]|uniref:Rieske (2Fe-2S) protein n=1 Tax=Luteococcus peritonei TaxID=88874 RepID=A0ABW4RSN4_9ACTN